MCRIQRNTDCGEARRGGFALSFKKQRLHVVKSQRAKSLAASKDWSPESSRLTVFIDYT